MGYAIAFILGLAAGVVFSILKPKVWGKAQEEIKDKIT